MPGSRRTEIIVAIATAPGRGGIGVVRVSGPLVPAIARAVLGALPEPRKATLCIARDAWPNYLKEIGRIEPAARRDQLIEAEAARLTAHPMGPVIAAGSSGSMPATAKFLHAVAKLANGAVVLPGLDTDLDEESWDTIGGERSDDGRFTTPPSSNHPQFAMHALLDSFGIKRRDVESLAEPAPLGREVLVSETMRPSTATAQWHDRLERPEIVARISAGMTHLTVVEAPNPEMEALAIAVAMREASIKGSIVGAYILAIVESFGSILLPDPSRALAYKDAYGLILLVLVLLCRPQGLFGDKERRA